MSIYVKSFKVFLTPTPPHVIIISLVFPHTWPLIRFPLFCMPFPNSQGRNEKKTAHKLLMKQLGN